MDDEYRAFLESAWNWSSETICENGGHLDLPGKNAARVTHEVVEIEADDEGPEDEAEAGSGSGGGPGLGDAQEAWARRSRSAGAALLPASLRSRNGTVEGRGMRSVEDVAAHHAKQLGASAKTKPAPPVRATAPMERPAHTQRTFSRVELSTFVGTWTDSMGNSVRVEWADPGDKGVLQLDVKLTRKGSSRAPIQIKVTQHDDGGFSCGRFALDADQSHPDRIVWADRRLRSRTSVWERETLQLDQGGAIGSRGSQAAAPGGCEATQAAAAKSAAPDAAASATGAAAATQEATSTAQKAPVGLAALAPREGVRSLGARAKVKAARPVPLAVEAPLEANSDDQAVDLVAEIELPTFLGDWVDSMGHSVRVDWARPAAASESNSGNQLDVRLIKMGARESIPLKISRQESGLFSCGHFTLDTAKSSPSHIVWADKFNPAKTSTWCRASEGRVPKAATVALGLKRSWSADATPSLANSKLPRVNSEPSGTGGAGLRGVQQQQQQQQQHPKPRLVAHAKDAEGRLYDLESVVVNFADVGMSYAKSVLDKGSKQGGIHDFDWEGVRRCVRYIRAEREMKIFGVIPEDFQAQDSGSGHRCGLPFDIQLMCECVEEVLPYPLSGQEGAAREMTVERAYERNCLYVDSGSGASPLVCHARCRAWLDKCRDLVHLRYFFDTTLGTFDVFDGNVGTPTLARMNSFG